MELEIRKLPKEAKREAWDHFKDHHYLTQQFQVGANAFLVIWDNEAVAFTSSIPLPSGTLKNAWREHRTVVLPDYQGMGMGVRISDWLGGWHLLQGHRFYSRTSHPRMGWYRDASPLWKPTSKDKMRRNPEWSRALKDNKESKTLWSSDVKRVARSHEYIGA